MRSSETQLYLLLILPFLSILFTFSVFFFNLLLTFMHFLQFLSSFSFPLFSRAPTSVNKRLCPSVGRSFGQLVDNALVLRSTRLLGLVSVLFSRSDSSVIFFTFKKLIRRTFGG